MQGRWRSCESGMPPWHGAGRRPAAQPSLMHRSQGAFPASCIQGSLGGWVARRRPQRQPGWLQPTRCSAPWRWCGFEARQPCARRAMGQPRSLALRPGGGVLLVAVAVPVAGIPLACRQLRGAAVHLRDPGLQRGVVGTASTTMLASRWARFPRCPAKRYSLGRAAGREGHSAGTASEWWRCRRRRRQLGGASRRAALLCFFHTTRRAAARQRCARLQTCRHRSASASTRGGRGQRVGGSRGRPRCWEARRTGRVDDCAAPRTSWEPQHGRPVEVRTRHGAPRLFLPLRLVSIAGADDPSTCRACAATSTASPCRWCSRELYRSHSAAQCESETARMGRMPQAPRLAPPLCGGGGTTLAAARAAAPW